MKNIIVEIHEKANIKLDKITPEFKTATKSIDITDVNPIALAEFMRVNNIPEHTYFDGKDDSYDRWECSVILLSWSVEIARTSEEKLTFKRERFSTVAFKMMFDVLVKEMKYKRVGVISNLLKAFDDTTVYDMFINKEYDRLVEYYSLYFKK